MPDDPRHLSFTPCRATLFVNPRAGRGLGQHVADALVARLGLPADVVTDHPATATLPGPADVAIAIGGDGTLRAVVERLLGEGRVPPVLPVPLGTANLMGQHLGLPRPVTAIAHDGLKTIAGELLGGGLDRALASRIRRRLGRLGRGLILPEPKRLARRLATTVARALARGEARRLDVGELGTSAGRGTFLLMAGVGFDAHVVAELDRRRAASRGPIGLASYALPAANALATGSFPELTVTADGRRLFGPEPGLIMIANVAEYGTGFPIAPHARSDDGLLDVTCLPCRGPADLAKLALQAAAGWHTGLASADRARHVRVTAAGRVPVQRDGDPAGELPLCAEVREAAVPFVPLRA